MGRKNDRAMLPEIAIFGLGNWGVSLAQALRVAGIPPIEIVATSKQVSGIAIARRTRVRGFSITPFESAGLDARILWLCVPDAAIEEVTHRLVERIRRQPSDRGEKPLMGRIVVHSSGALGSKILEEAARAGAAVASVHPLMTFPTRVPVSLMNIPFGVEATPRVQSTLDTIVRHFGGRPFALDGSTKAFYHAATVLASPLLASLLAATGETAALAGIPPGKARQLLQPIAQATLHNVFTRGAAKSFSGPVARGDAATIQLHLHALAPHPMLADIYRPLARYGADTLPARNREKLRQVLHGGPGRG